MSNVYTVDWTLYKKWVNESRFRGGRLTLFICWCGLLLVSLAYIVISFVVDLDYSFLYIAIAILSIYRAFFHYLLNAKQQFKIVTKTYGKDSWVRTVLFEDDAFYIKDEDKAESKFSYGDIADIIEKDDSVHIKLKAKTYIRLYKSKFIDCNWEECKAFILKNSPDLM